VYPRCLENFVTYVTNLGRIVTAVDRKKKELVAFGNGGLG
jgi:hypothetical protein